MTLYEGGGEPDAETLIRRVIDMIGTAKPLPLSTTVRIEKDEVLELLDDALDRLPTELRQARYMLRDKDDYLARVQREADEILDAARVRAGRMVERTDVVREADKRAARILEEAREQARQLRMDAEDYCDQKLAAFEIVLERTAKTVAAGRDKLRVTPLPPAEEGQLGYDEQGAPGGPEQSPFFDQDG